MTSSATIVSATAIAGGGTGDCRKRAGRADDNGHSEPDEYNEPDHEELKMLPRRTVTFRHPGQLL